MTDESPLIDVMRKNPEDKNARLIYADWLEEQGDPRAELNRLVGMNANWYCGKDLRKSALDAMHFAWDTQVRMFVGEEYYTADATRVFHEFAGLIARTVLESQQASLSSGEIDRLNEMLAVKEAWIEAALGTATLRERFGRILSPSSVDDPTVPRADGWENENPAVTAIRLASNTIALCAAKHTSRFGQRLRVESVGLPRQDFHLTQMLIDRCRWRRE